MTNHVAQLHDLACRLHADGMDPLDLALEVSRLNQQLGRPVRVAADVVRELPGLEAFDAVEAWQQQWADPAYLREAFRRYHESPEYQAEFRRPPLAVALSPEERRRRVRAGRQAALMAEHIDLFEPALVDLIRDVMVEDLPTAISVLRQAEGGRGQ